MGVVVLINGPNVQCDEVTGIGELQTYSERNWSCRSVQSTKRTSPRHFQQHILDKTTNKTERVKILHLH